MDVTTSRRMMTVFSNKSNDGSVTVCSARISSEHYYHQVEHAYELQYHVQWARPKHRHKSLSRIEYVKTTTKESDLDHVLRRSQNCVFSKSIDVSPRRFMDELVCAAHLPVRREKSSAPHVATRWFRTFQITEIAAMRLVNMPSDTASCILPIA